MHSDSKKKPPNVKRKNSLLHTQSTQGNPCSSLNRPTTHKCLTLVGFRNLPGFCFESRGKCLWNLAPSDEDHTPSTAENHAFFRSDEPLTTVRALSYPTNTKQSQKTHTQHSARRTQFKKRNRHRELQRQKTEFQRHTKLQRGPPYSIRKLILNNFPGNRAPEQQVTRITECAATTTECVWPDT